jgi:DNA repair exonuclease SbcCD ATPase subunit
MLKIRAIKLDVNTTSGFYGAKFEFSEGLNIIRADNTTGKSTLFQAILYGLGMEELLNGTNEKTMQAVLKDTVEYPEDSFHKIISSFVYLEFENNEIITTKRSVKQDGRSGKLIEIYKGSLIINEEKNLISQPTFVHDKGGASSQHHGFHAFLERFLGWDLPKVQSTKGDLRKLYIQSIFPSFIIEQKTGWSDFLATIPFLGLKNVKNRLVEFLLGLEVFELEIKKQELSEHKQILIEKWKNLRTQTLILAEKGGVNINNLSNYPEILSNSTPISFYMIKDEKILSLVDYYEEEKLELSTLENTSSASLKTGKNIDLIQQKLEESQEELEKVSIAFDIVSKELRMDKLKLKRYQKQLEEVEDDLQKNKGAKKVYELGATIPIKLAQGVCPTCNQEVKDTLLPQDLRQQPMRIDENIKYLEAQKKMIVAYLSVHEKSVVDKKRIYNRYQYLMNYELRPLIRNLKMELVSDIRQPSEIEIENKLKKRSRVKFYNELIEELYNKISDFQELSNLWKRLNEEINKFPMDTYSIEDKNKLKIFEESFKKLVKNFGYRSKPTSLIKISLDNYLPQIQSQLMRYNIRFDSSASDLIRSIWSYTCSFLNVADKYPNTNHPRFMAFDEPAQQNMANKDFKSFLQELSNYKKCQILVFASFNQSDEVYKETTEGIDFELHWIKDRLIKPVN